MTRTAILPEGMQQPKLPYSYGVSNGRLVFVSGQVGDEHPDIKSQTRAVLEKIGRILRAGGSDYPHVLRTTIHLKDPALFEEMNTVYREFFPKDPPARVTLVCDLLRPSILVEIDAIADVPA